jgi:diguanylate cyclase (GGDEF)-like protein
MVLHIPSLLVTLVVGLTTLAIPLLLVRRQLLQHQQGLGQWAVAMLVVLAGFASLAVQFWGELANLEVAGYGLIGVGFVLQGRTLLRFVRDREIPVPVLVLSGIGWLCLLALAQHPSNTRAAALPLIYAGLLGHGAWVTLRYGWRAERSLRVVGVALVAAVASLLARAAHAWFAPDQYQRLLQDSVGQSWSILAIFVGLSATTLGFVLACLEREMGRMETLASRDGLTGCINRTTADTLLEHTLQRAARQRETVALVLLDIDHFKQVNDRYGHHAGDIVLQRFAETVRSRLRASDIFCRLGGEEFGIILPATDAPGARRLAEEVRVAVAAMQVRTPRHAEVTLSISAGVAVAIPDVRTTVERMLARADEALYRAKHAGRNRVEQATVEMALVRR